MTDRELMQQAVEAMESSRVFVTTREKIKYPEGTEWYDERITALRERLAQPNEFQPDWDAMAVMVGEQQRMAKRIEELEAQPEQKPVAWRWRERINSDFDSWVVTSCEPPPYAVEKQPLYTAPALREPITDDHGQALRPQYRVIEKRGKWVLLYDQHQSGEVVRHEFRIQKLQHDIVLYPGITLTEAQKRFREKVEADNE